MDCILLGVQLSAIKSFVHRFRHSFVAAFGRCAPRDTETRERLVGHSVPGVTGRYGNSHESEAHDMALLEERAKALALLKY